jgi:predicted aspartyl protease
MRFVLLLTAAVVAMCAPGLAADCGQLKLISSVDLTSNANGTAEYVPVQIAGVSKLLLLDSGSSMTVMTAKTAKELKLEGHRSMTPPTHMTANELMLAGRRTGARVYGDTGRYSEEYVLAPMVLGTLNDNSITFMVAPEGANFGDDTRVAGALGADILQHFDVSIDFGKHTLALIDQNHCEGNVVYWPAASVAVVPFERLRTGQIVFEVTLDGRPVKAILDTGAFNSTLYQGPAEGTFGLTLGSADTPATGTLGGDAGSTVWQHKFKSLTFAGVTVLNPEFSIIPNRISKHFDSTELGSLISRPSAQAEPDVLLGMNVLKHLHVYIAYREKKLYITPSEPTAQSEAKPK